MRELKQSTAATIVMGPFVDDTDGKTAETGLTISQADIRISKNGGAFAQTNNATGATHMENGYYSIPLDTTDTNTLGRIVVCVSESGALPVRWDAMILPAVEYDTRISGTDTYDVNVTSMAANTVTASAIATGAIDADSIAADAITAAKVAADVTTEIQSGLATSSALTTVSNNITTLTGYVDTEVAAILAAVDTEVAAIKAKTDNLPADPADASDVAALIAGLNNISVANIFAGGDIDGYTLEEALKLALAILAGKVTVTGGTSVVFRAADDSKDRVTATVDTDGQRTAVTLDATG